MTFSTEIKNRILAWNTDLAGEMDLSLFMPEGEPGRTLTAFAEAFTRLAPKVRVHQKSDHDGDGARFDLGRGIIYRAVPEGPELEPFLEALFMINAHPSANPDSARSAFQTMTLPAHLRLHIAPRCPFCPKAVRQVLALALSNDLMQLDIIDAFLFPHMARKDAVQATPSGLRT